MKDLRPHPGLDQTLQIKQPAAIVAADSRPVIMMTAPYHRKADLTTQVCRMVARGEVRPLQARPSYNSGNGEWEFPVLRLRDPAPAWRKPLMIAFALFSLFGSLAGLLAWVLTSLAATPLLLFLLGAGAALMVIARMSRPRTVHVHQNVNIR